MSIPFNPLKPKDDVLNATMLGAMGSGKVSANVVTFDSGGAQAYADDQDIPGFESLLKARFFGTIDGSNLIEQDSNGKGRILVTTAARSGFFVGKNDLNTLNSGLWNVTYEFQADTIGVQLDTMITGSQLAVLPNPEPADETVGIAVFPNGDVRFRFRASGGGALTDFQALGAAAYIPGTAICAGIQKTGTGYVFTFNGTVSATLVFASVQTQVSEFLAAGELFLSTSGELFYDNLGGLG